MRAGTLKDVMSISRRTCAYACDNADAVAAALDNAGFSMVDFRRRVARAQLVTTLSGVNREVALAAQDAADNIQDIEEEASEAIASLYETMRDTSTEEQRQAIRQQVIEINQGVRTLQQAERVLMDENQREIRTRAAKDSKKLTNLLFEAARLRIEATMTGLERETALINIEYEERLSDIEGNEIGLTQFLAAHALNRNFQLEQIEQQRHDKTLELAREMLEIRQASAESEAAIATFQAQHLVAMFDEEDEGYWDARLDAIQMQREAAILGLSTTLAVNQKEQEAIQDRIAVGVQDEEQRRELVQTLEQLRREEEEILAERSAVNAEFAQKYRDTSQAQRRSADALSKLSKLLRDSCSKIRPMLHFLAATQMSRLKPSGSCRSSEK